MTGLSASTDLHHIQRTAWPLLGTVVEVRCSARDRSELQRVEAIVFAEIDRLQGVFNIYDSGSLLRRWSLDPQVPLSTEFESLVARALDWQNRSRGAFNIHARALHRLWQSRADQGRRPSPQELRDVTRLIAQPPLQLDPDGLHQTGSCLSLDLNAIAKGWIVDRAVAAAWDQCALDSLVISAGGDIRHRGSTPIQIGIEDPRNALDNGAPLATINLQNSAVATSGSGRRWFDIDGEHISQVLDPRTGQPADSTLSVTVQAPDAATADVLATILTVLSIAEGRELLGRLDMTGEGVPDAVRCWVVGRDGVCVVLGEE